MTKLASKELVFVTEENEDSDEEDPQLRVMVQGDLLRKKEQEAIEAVEQAEPA